MSDNPNSGLDPEFVQKFQEAPEILLFYAIRTIGGSVWHHNHNRADGRPTFTTDEDVEKLQKQIEFLVDQTKRFGVETPRRENGTGTEEYFRWYRWWNSYERTLSDTQFQELNRDLEANADLSKWRPPGDWRLSSENPAVTSS